MLFIEASGNTDISYLKRMIRLGADIKRKGAAALVKAVSSNNYETAEYLFENGAELISVSKKGTPLLYLALKNSNHKMAKLLLENGEDIDVKYKGISALHSAVINNNIKQVSFLIEYGAYLDIKDEDNKTPIEYAYTKGYVEIEKLLAEYGADESLKFVIRNRLKNIPPPPRKVAFDIRYFLKWQPGSRASTVIFFIMLVLLLFISESLFSWTESLKLLLGKTETAEGEVHSSEDGMVSYSFSVEDKYIEDSAWGSWRQGQAVKVYYLKSLPEISRISGTSNIKLIDFFIMILPVTLLMIFVQYKSRTKKGKKINRIKVLKKGKITDAAVIKNKEITYEWYKCHYKYADDDREVTEDFDYIKSNLSKSRGLRGDSLPLLYIKTRQKKVSLLTDTLIKEMGVKSKIVCRKGKWCLKPLILNNYKAFIHILFRYFLAAGIGFFILLSVWNVLLVALGI